MAVAPHGASARKGLFAYQLKEELERMAQVEMHQGPPELEALGTHATNCVIVVVCWGK